MERIAAVEDERGIYVKFRIIPASAHVLILKLTGYGRGIRSAYWTGSCPYTFPIILWALIYLYGKVGFRYPDEIICLWAYTLAVHAFTILVIPYNAWFAGDNIYMVGVLIQVNGAAERVQNISRRNIDRSVKPKRLVAYICIIAEYCRISGIYIKYKLHASVWKGNAVVYIAVGLSLIHI